MDVRRSYTTVVEADGPVAWCDVFNTPDYHRLHLLGRDLYLRTIDDDTGDVAAVSHFSEIEPGIFRSPARGTYGGIDLARHELSLVEHVIGEGERLLSEAGARELRIVTAPQAHDTVRSSLVTHGLLQHGYRVSQSELNYSVVVDDDALAAKMRRNNQKRLRKCVRSGFDFRSLPVGEGAAVHAVIEANRSAKGYPLSMSWPQVQEMVQTFPERMSFFAVTEGERMIAAAICLTLNPRVLYVPYWGDVPGFEQHSPVTMLADGIYQFARDSGFHLLDIGTAPHDHTSRGLMRFKENLGCEATLKLGFARTL